MTAGPGNVWSYIGGEVDTWASWAEVLAAGADGLHDSFTFALVYLVCGLWFA